MKSEISQSEKLDIILALEMKFQNPAKISEFDFSEERLKLLPIIEKERLNLKKKLTRFDSLKPEKKEIWQALWMEKIKKGGETKRLDETIHPEQIAKVLKGEPINVLLIIQEKLPDILVNQVANILQNQELLIFLQKKNITQKNLFVPQPRKEILALVRQGFLNNFIAFEDLYQTFEIDKLTPQKLGNFIWFLGIREIAIYCRKIKTKEDLANFLLEFDSNVKKEIVNGISELNKITPIRASRAESLINEIFLMERFSNDKVRSLGLRILANLLSQRDFASQKFTIQKLPVEIGETLKSYMFLSIREYEELTLAEKSLFQEYNREILDLAQMFLKDYSNESEHN